MNALSDTSLYEHLGGSNACRRLAKAFYARVATDPVLRAIYPSSSHCAVEALGAFFVQIFGGPKEYSQRRYWLSLREAHARFRIGPAEREAWLRTMDEALNDVGIQGLARDLLRSFFEHSSAYLMNHPEPAALETTATPAETGEPLERDLAERWSVHQVLDEIVAAVRKRNADHAIALAQTPAIQGCREHDAAAFVGMLAEMESSGSAKLYEFVRQALLAHPDLAHERYYYHRTLLHHAAARGNIDLMKLLLELGVDPNAGDEFGHTPLYCAGNEHGNEMVVRALVEAGAHLDSQDRVKHCTALHMAARRANVVVARALLDCGAGIEVRDRNGETPLRRAVNCSKPEMAEFLLSRGADPNSVGSKGIAAWQAARGEEMKRVFGRPKS